MNELIFIQYAFYLLGIFALIKIVIMELEEIVIRVHVSSVKPTIHS